ncbi:MAG TPA: hypothetical protein VKV69_02510, partial [Actinomycetota bacterium]|nr:hypothetical protein [Actinomycetota bacterium]
MSARERLHRPIRPLAASIRSRFRVTILLAVLVGALTGLLVAGIEEAINAGTWGKIATSSSWWIIALPLAGLIVSALLLDRTKE